MLAVLGALAVVAEVAAVRTGQAGFFSAGFAFVLAAALVPGGGVPVAALILALALLARTVFAGRWQAALVDLTAGLAALAATRLAPPLGSVTAVTVWVVGTSLVGKITGQRTLRDQLLPQALAVACAGLLLGQLEGYPALLLVPVLAGLQLSATATVLAREERDKLELQLQLASAQQQAEVAGARAQQLAGELSQQLAEKGLVEELARGLLASRDRESVRRALVKAAGAVVRGGRVEVRLEPEEGERPVRLIVQDEVSEDQAALLRLVASHGALALQSAELSEGLQRWADGLSALLASYQALAGTLDSTVLRTRLDEQLALLVPSRGRGVFFGEEEPPAAWGVAVAAARATGRPQLSESLTLMVAPLWSDEGALGTLVVEGGPFTPVQLDLLFALALEGAVALRNSRLHQQVVAAHAQFRQAQAQLVQTSKLAAVGQLAAGVAHELNSPLGAMMMVLEWLQTKLAEEHGHLASKVETALRSGRKLQNIIDKLLHYSRSDPGLLAPLSPAVVVADTLELVGNYLNKEGIAVERDIPADLKVVSNPNELQQVLTNLLLNARDVLKEAPTRRITVSARAGDGVALLTISDSGPGVAEGVRERIFEPFFTTKEVGQGTGLGLSLSREIAARHGGTLELLPSEEGACFGLTLPLC